MDLSQKPDEGPRRPIRKYPAQMFGNQQRSFQSGWGRPEQRLGTLGHQYKKSDQRIIDAFAVNHNNRRIVLVWDCK